MMQVQQHSTTQYSIPYTRVSKHAWQLDFVYGVLFLDTQNLDGFCLKVTRFQNDLENPNQSFLCHLCIPSFEKKYFKPIHLQAKIILILYIYPKSILYNQSHAKCWVWVMESIMCFKSCLHSHYDGNLANGTLIKKITLISPGTLFKGFKGDQRVVTIRQNAIF